MYSSDLYQKALNRLDRRREEDELRTAATLAEVSAKVPRLEEIQNQLRQVGFSISKPTFTDASKMLRKSSIPYDRIFVTSVSEPTTANAGKLLKPSVPSFGAIPPRTV